MIWFLSIVLCTVCALLALLDYLIKRFTTFNMAKVIPGPPIYNIIGSTALNFTPQRMFALKTFSDFCLCLISVQKICYFTSIDCVVLDKAFQMTIELSKTYPKGFVYWTMGYLGYTCYSADAFEVSIIIFKP